MGERVAASFQAGGKMTVEQAQALVQMAKDYGLHTEEGGNVPALDNLGEVWYDNEINYGDLDRLTIYAAQQGIDYVYWFDAGSEWAENKLRSIDGQCVEFACIGGEAVVTIDELTKTDAFASGWAALHERIKLWKRELPPAVIVG